MKTFFQIINIIQIIIFVYLSISSLYFFIFSFASLFTRKKTFPKSEKKLKFAILIPGYKEDNVIVDVAKNALKQNYPHNLFDVVIIADSFKSETLAELKKLPIITIEVAFKKSTKSKALNKAMSQLTKDYDVAIILDADNIMEQDFIEKINNAMLAGNTIIQGHRTAKNLNSSFAILDAVSEEMNNNIFRKGHRNLGLSSAIIGSGMAFKYDFFKALMKNITAVGGFDKEIELKVLKDRYKIEYLENAYVYDEKVQKSEVFSNQRRRWLSAQIHYFRKDFLNALWHLLSKGNIDYFDKALQFILPPRILLIGILFIICIFSLFLNPVSFTIVWLITLTVCIITFLFSIPKKFYNLKTLKAILSLPKGFILMLLSLLNIKGANKKFIHTEHSNINEDKK
ncbi:MAG: glycosyltransferase family 2 protein [Bacteroidales bacterium]|nr:glycosyltransferase family 2 protein [Bacteroidales bacterium]